MSTGAAGMRGDRLGTLRTIGLVGLPAAALIACLVLVAWRARLLLAVGSLQASLLAVAVLVLVVLGAWVLWRELMFGAAAQRVMRVAFPSGVAATTPSTSTGAAPEGDWRDWCLVAIDYDLAGDRRSARAAMRTAIRLHRAS